MPVHDRDSTQSNHAFFDPSLADRFPKIVTSAVGSAALLNESRQCHRLQSVADLTGAELLWAPW
jgi:hypothetical protein